MKRIRLLSNEIFTGQDIALTKDILKKQYVIEFMDAIDEVMNSNTFLLVIKHDSYFNELSFEENFDTYIHSDKFLAIMHFNDQYRDWYNYYDCINQRLFPGTFVKYDYSLKVQEVDFSAVKTRLNWFLTKSFSYYDCHYPTDRSIKVVDNFIQEINLDARNKNWQYFFIEPNFLYDENYFNGGWEEENDNLEELKYFSGGGNDTATYITNSEISYLLLTNGNP